MILNVKTTTTIRWLAQERDDLTVRFQYFRHKYDKGAFYVFMPKHTEKKKSQREKTSDKTKRDSRTVTVSE